jgi:integrin beta 2
VRNLYGISLFENDLYVTNWRNESVYRINKYTGESVLALKSNKSRPFSIHAYHRQRQPEGLFRKSFFQEKKSTGNEWRFFVVVRFSLGINPPCKLTNNNCQHLCVPLGKNGNTTQGGNATAAQGNAVCMCKAGYKSVKDGRCTRKFFDVTC